MMPWHRGSDGQATRLEDLRRASVIQERRNRRAIHLLGAVATVWSLYDYLAVGWLFAWLAMLALSLRMPLLGDPLLPQTDDAGARDPSIRKYLRAPLINALIWTLPVAFAWTTGDPLLQAQVWSATIFVIGASAVILVTMPLSSLILIGCLAGLHFAIFLIDGFLGMALSSIALGVISITGALLNARRYAIAGLAVNTMQEKDAVVSLLLREFEEGDADWLWQIDTEGRVYAPSPRFAFALAKDQAEIEGTPLIELIAGAHRHIPVDRSVQDLADRLDRREQFSNLPVRTTIDGSLRWWELSGTFRLDETGAFAGFHGVGSDITAARESSEKIAYLARYDTLTGLPNRATMTDALATALSRAVHDVSRCAFLMIDLDRFKTVNDTLGHHVGDQLLAHVSNRLREEMGEEQLCCRMGGDEFAVVIPGVTDDTQIGEIAERLIQRLSQPYAVGHHTLFVGVSIGSAIGPRDGATGETLMRNADLALYRAKDAGGNAHFIYEPALHAIAEKRRQLEAALRNALAANEFELYYQPVVDAETSRIVSLEALLRWHSADHGTVSPTQFVPVAEDTRLVIPIGEWVLRNACLEAIRWPDHIRIAVNVSGEQLLDPQFADMVVSALAQSGLAPQRLEIEVTESIFVRDAALARSALEQVIALGCTVALDDFGTGYSSLGYLRELRFSTIKIDRTFVQGAATGNIESLAIIRAVVAMAESLEMSTTAEGVETAQELDVVRNLGCRKIQGYYFGRPMAAGAAGALFDTRLADAR